MQARTWRVHLATLNFGCRLGTFFFGLSRHTLYWMEMEKERAENSTAPNVKGGTTTRERSGDRDRQRQPDRPLAAFGSFEQPESSCHLLSIHHVTALDLPPAPAPSAVAVSLPFSLRSRPPSPARPSGSAFCLPNPKCYDSSLDRCRISHEPL